MEPTSMVVFAKVLVSLISGGVFLMALVILKSIVAQGVAYAISEFMIQNATNDQINRMCRWWTNGKNIQEELEKIRKANESNV